MTRNIKVKRSRVYMSIVPSPSRPCARSLLVAVALATAPAVARADAPVQVMFKAHRMVPDHLTVPAGVRFRLQVVNQDSTVDELESYDLKLEKIVVAGGTATVNAGPLHPGTYKLFDDYHPDTANGVITATGPDK
jgi:hypothetical protein